MTHKAPSLGRETIGVPEQGAHIQHRWPSFECSVSDGKLTCVGTVRPDPFSREYRVRIEYRAGRSPRIWVEDPPIERRPQEPDEPIPHTYRYHIEGEERPCLDFDAWHPGRRIADTMVPWTCEWLLHYEAWRQTGVWCGGGIGYDGPEAD